MPKRPEATENTSREGEALKKERTAASTPRAQPTETRQPERGTNGNREPNAEAAAAEGEREPENPTEGRSESKETKAEAGDKTVEDVDIRQPTKKN